MSVAVRIVATAARALPATRAHRLVTLIYHRVHPQPDRMFPGEVDGTRFDWQMSLLRRHCHPLPLADAAAKLRSASLPPRAVAVTFDDGYADNETTALPILERYGIEATFFVAPGFLDGGRMWNDSIIETVRRAPDAQLDLTDFGLGIQALGPVEARGAVAEGIIRAVKHLQPEERREKVELLARRIGVDLPDDLMMTSAQVRRLAEAGMTIGAHTMTHPILRTLDDDAAEQEIRESREMLEAITGRPVRAFAYPNGRPGDDYTERDRNMVASLGFDFAPSTVWGAATASSDVFQLPRFTPWDSTPARWLTRLLLTFGRRA
jgi:peptidoglycan/xylan/chitin deacetylase (PgdA/CDA1 family)